MPELGLAENQLTTLPVEIGNLTNLWCLDLGGNQLPEALMTAYAR